MSWNLNLRGRNRRKLVPHTPPGTGDIAGFVQPGREDPQRNTGRLCSSAKFRFDWVTCLGKMGSQAVLASIMTRRVQRPAIREMGLPEQLE